MRQPIVFSPGSVYLDLQCNAFEFLSSTGRKDGEPHGLLRFIDSSQTERRNKEITVTPEEAAERFYGYRQGVR